MAAVAQRSARDDPDTADSDLPEYREIMKESGMCPVSGAELRRSVGAEREEWKQAMEMELQSFESKGVFRKMSRAEGRSVSGSKIVPMKIVAGIKPPKPEDPQQRRIKRVRGVACGNFQSRSPEEVKEASKKARGGYSSM